MINLARRLLKGALAFRAARVQAISGHSTGTQSDSGMGVALDSAGNFIFAGYTSPSGALPGWVAKFDSTMTLSWQRKQSYTARFATNGVGLDSSDNIYAFGSGYVSASPSLPVLFKYNSSGTLQWQRKLTSADDANCYGPAVNASGDAFFAIGSTAATPYSMVAKYNTSGAIQWQRKISSTYRCYVQGIAFASDGGILLSGSFYDGANAAANERGWVIKYDTSGAIQWQFKIHWAAAGAWNAVAADPVTGDIYIVGQYNVGANSAGVIAKLNSSGTHQWSRRHPTTSSQMTVVAVDPATGYVYANVGAIGASNLTCWDASGNLLWERYLTGDTGTRLTFYSLVVAAGELLLSGVANHSAASKGTDAVMLRMPLSGGVATACGYINIAIPSTTAFTTPAAPTNVAAGLTDAAGTWTDAAGTATDAAGAMTFTNYTN